MILWPEQFVVTPTFFGKAQYEAYDGLYGRLGMREGEKVIYKLAKVREWCTGDLDRIRCIEDENERVLVKDKEIKS